MCGFSAKTEKFPSESPFESIFIVDPVTPDTKNNNKILGKIMPRESFEQGNPNGKLTFIRAIVDNGFDYSGSIASNIVNYIRC